jgi:hypothetical protein
MIGFAFLARGCANRNVLRPSPGDLRATGRDLVGAGAAG